MPVRPEMMLVAVAGSKVWIVRVKLDQEPNISLTSQLVYTWTPGFHKNDPPKTACHEHIYSIELIMVPENDHLLGSLGDILCVTAGYTGFIHLLNISSTKHVCSIPIDIGRIEINEIVLHPRVWHWVGIACKDNGIRIVDLRSKNVILILGGIHGHRQQALSMDIHPTLPLIVSGAADNTVRLWTIPHDTELHNSELPIRIHTSLYASSWTHANLVDSVKFLGDTVPTVTDVIDWSPVVISKSIDGEIVIFRFPTTSPNIMDHRIVAETDERGPRLDFIALLKFPKHKRWCYKFTLTPCQQFLVLGLMDGTVLVWDLLLSFQSVHRSLIKLDTGETALLDAATQIHPSWAGLDHLVKLRDALVPSVGYRDCCGGPIVKLDTDKKLPIRKADLKTFSMCHDSDKFLLIAGVNDAGSLWLGVLQDCS